MLSPPCLDVPPRLDVPGASHQGASQGAQGRTGRAPREWPRRRAGQTRAVLRGQSLRRRKKITKKKKKKTRCQGLAVFFFQDNKRHFKRQEGVERLERLPI